MSLRSISTVIVGAGPYGLGMSQALTRRGIDHLVLERRRSGTSWRRAGRRSLRLITPNWANGLPGAPYAGDDPDGFMSASDFADQLDRYRAGIAPPLQAGTAVTAVQPGGGGFVLSTTSGPIGCRNLVVATGACASATVPKLAASFPPTVVQCTAQGYREPGMLPAGKVLVVGASASGVQIARELQLTGRQVILSVGRHLRLPRRYRGRDIYRWLDELGVMDARFTQVDDLHRARRLPSPQLSGGPGAVDLAALRGLGVELVGRLMDIRGTHALFSGGLAHQCAAADSKLARLYRTIEEHIAGLLRAPALPEPDPLGAVLPPREPRLELDLTAGEIGAVIWATGYRPALDWLPPSSFDRRRRLAHSGGVVESVPGLYLLGLPFLRRRRSGLISGIGPDCSELAQHIAGRLAASRAA